MRFSHEVEEAQPDGLSIGGRGGTIAVIPAAEEHFISSLHGLHALQKGLKGAGCNDATLHPFPVSLMCSFLNQPRTLLRLAMQSFIFTGVVATDGVRFGRGAFQLAQRSRSCAR
jgi:hypothetical protein